MSEKLIELVRQYEFLYNPTLEQYKVQTLRNAAWDAIGEEQNATGEECKVAWGKLRNCYSNALKRRSKKRSTSAKALHPWRYEKQMAFLKPFVDFKDSTSAFKNEIDSYISEEDSKDPLETLAKLRKTPIDEESSSDRTLDKFIEVIESTEHETKKKKKINQIHKTEPVQTPAPSPVLAQTPNLHQPHQMDGTDLFFQSMSQCVKRLPKIEQARIRMDVHKIVNDAEMHYLLNGQNSSLLRQQENSKQMSIPALSKIPSSQLISMRHNSPPPLTSPAPMSSPSSSYSSNIPCEENNARHKRRK